MIGPLRFRRCAASVLLVAFAALSAVPAADPKTPLAGTDIYKKVLKSAVWIAHAVHAPDGRIGIASGSGSLIDVTGRYVLTNYHVVSDQQAVAVFFPQYDSNKKLIAVRDHYTKQLLTKGGLEGKVIYKDQKRDLAVIHLPSLPPGVAAVPLARDSVGPGDSVHSIGNPGASGALWAYSPGSVKAVYPKRWEVIDRDGGSMRFEAQVVETTSPVNPGDSGGPLVNSFGELAAVTQGGVTAMGTISYFIDISEVRKTLSAAKVRISNPPAAASNSETKSDEKGEKVAATEEAENKEESLAQNKLNFCELYRDQPAKYKEKLQEVIKLYPNTKAAKTAKDMLAKLK